MHAALMNRATRPGDARCPDRAAGADVLDRRFAGA
jgi:hypothetical protein